MADIVNDSENTPSRTTEIFLEIKNDFEDDNGDEDEDDQCRVCLGQDLDLLPLFPPQAPFFNTMINYCTTLQVRKDDDFPTHICVECSRNLEISYKFKKLAEKSNNTLLNRLFLRKVKREAKITVPRSVLSASSKTLKKIEFNSIDEIKNKLNLKTEDLNIKQELDFKEEEIESAIDVAPGHNVVICNTIIKKIDKDDIPLSNFCSKRKNTSDDENDFGDDFAANDYDDDDWDYDDKSEVAIVTKKKKVKKLKKIKNKKQKFTNVEIMAEGDDDSERQNDFNGSLLRGPVNLLTPIPVSDRGDPYIQELAKSLTNIYDLGGSKPRKPYNMSLKPRKNKKSADKDKNRLPKEKHVCPVCGILTYGLGSHLLIHEDKKPFTCEECKKQFIQKANYDMHMKKHTGVKDQICEICGAAFFFIKSVIRHKLIHKGERPFPCNLCPKTFIAKCDLNRHLKVHAGYKPFKCAECTMSFNAKHQLITHIRMHTGEKPYTCEICKLAFTYKVNLNNHVYKVHGVNLKFKSIYKVTAEVLSREYQMDNTLGSMNNSIVQPIT